MDEIRFEYDCGTSALHFHDELELLFVLSGRVGVMFDGGNYLLGLEDFIVFNPFEYHELYREAGSHTLSAYIPFSELQKRRIRKIRCCSVGQKEENYLGMIRRKLAWIYKNYLKGEASGELEILSGVYGLLAVLQQHFQAPSFDERGPDSQDSAGKLRQVLLYIHEHYTENMSLQEAAEKNYLSAGHLSRLFEKQMGMHFSEYLRNLRLRRAAGMLRTMDKPVIEIAQECGFSNVNTLTSNFRLVYGEPPSVYRKQRISPEGEPEKRQTVNDIRLLKYAGSEFPEPKKSVPVSKVKADLSMPMQPLRMRHNIAINSGYIKDYMVEGHMEALEKCVREIGFRYVFVQGMLDDSINLYHERIDGTVWLNFTYLDRIIDHICSVGALPWLELSHTPSGLVDRRKMIFNDAYIQLPADLDKWEWFVEQFLDHLISRYGRERVSQWRLSLFPALFLSYGLFSAEEYLAYHHRTFRTIRSRLPEVKIIGGAFDSGYLMLDGPGILKQYLDYCREHQCMPDEIGLQIFCVDYSTLPRKEIESRILYEVTKNDAEPSPPSPDPDFTRHNLEFVRQVLDENQGEGIPISVIYWNSTIWHRDLGNDICYKAAFELKNCLEASPLVFSLNNNLFIDPRRGNISEEPFTGGGGAITWMGIPKAPYHALCMMSRLEFFEAARGDGYVVTCSRDRRSVRILLYHYCHYIPDCRMGGPLPEEEQLTAERYGNFEDPGPRSFQIGLKGLEKGEYDEERYTVSRHCGSSYDIWRSMGAPRVLSDGQREYLKRVSDPGYHYESRKIRESEDTLFYAVLDPHEVLMICLSRRDGVSFI